MSISVGYLTVPHESRHAQRSHEHAIRSRQPRVGVESHRPVLLLRARLGARRIGAGLWPFLGPLLRLRAFLGARKSSSLLNADTRHPADSGSSSSQLLSSSSLPTAPLGPGVLARDLASSAVRAVERRDGLRERLDAAMSARRNGSASNLSCAMKGALDAALEKRALVLRARVGRVWKYGIAWTSGIGASVYARLSKCTHEYEFCAPLSSTSSRDSRRFGWPSVAPETSSQRQARDICTNDAHRCR